MSGPKITSIIQHVVAKTLAASVPLVALSTGCGSSDDGSIVEDDAILQDARDGGGDTTLGVPRDLNFGPACASLDGLLGDLTPTESYDHISLRNSDSIIASTGVDCSADDADPVACPPALAETFASTINSMPTRVGWGYCNTFGGCSLTILAATRGGEVTVVGSGGEMRAFLGAIDTPQDAVMLVTASGYGVDECGADVVATDGQNFVVRASRRVSDCIITIETYELTVDSAGSITEKVLTREETGGCVGRIPEGFDRFADNEGDHPLGAYLAAMCQLEAAAVHAFEDMARELEFFGAPQALIDRARQAAQDEVHHTELTRAQARRFGVEPGTPEVHRCPPRSLFAFALDNATEGCVRETLGATVGCYQAIQAQDPDLAAMMATISEDESRHAQLSWDIAQWAATQLETEASKKIHAAQQAATQSAFADIPDVPVAVRHVLGIPSPDQWAALSNQLWGALGLTAASA